MTEHESKELLKVYGIPTTAIRHASTEAAAVKEANALGYPVVLKLHSETLTHKTDVGGVQLNIRNPAGVRQAFKLIRSSVSMPLMPFMATSSSTRLGSKMRNMRMASSPLAAVLTSKLRRAK